MTAFDSQGVGAGRPIYVLGINAYDHDTSACLLKDGVPVVAIAKERLSRIKHDVGWYGKAVDYCLFAAGIALDDVALVVACSYLLPTTLLERRLRSQNRPTIFPSHEREEALASPLYEGRGPPRRIDVSHHLAHAYSAFAPSPFERGVVYVADGVGSHRQDVMEAIPPEFEAGPFDRESESLYRFHGKELACVGKSWLPARQYLVNDDFLEMEGMGALYSRVSEYVFGHWNRCGEVMGLAPYGRLPPERLLEWRDGALVVHPWPRAWDRPFLGGGDRAWATSIDRAHYEDVACRVQADTEAIMLERARWLARATGERHLALAGGVALNCVANGNIVRDGCFEQVFVQPAAGDDGIALGAALYGWLAVLGGERRYVMDRADLGFVYPQRSVDRALAHPTLRWAASHRRLDDVAVETAALLAEGRVVGWYQGGSEYGPRALGQRSMLADPRHAAMRERLNRKVKSRQSFRPFAPAVLAERAADWFEGVGASPFMLEAHPVRPERKAQVPAIVHVDGTARVQTVHRETQPRFHALLEAFERLTGVPLLLNTSFNLRGEPIVESPMEAVEAFLSCPLDALVLHDELLLKRALGRRLLPLRTAWGARSRRGDAP